MVKVYRVDRTNGIAEIQAGNIILKFVRKGKKIKLYGKYKPEARVLDYAQLDVSKALFAQASRMAAGILFPKKSPRLQQTTLPF